jgi:hypothetical protein
MPGVWVASNQTITPSGEVFLAAELGGDPALADHQSAINEGDNLGQPSMSAPLGVAC